MDLGLSGRTALVCGASSGLGLASAEALAEEGANVVLFARRAEELDEHADAARRRRGRRRRETTTPTSSAPSSTAVERFGGLDVLVWNGGGPPPGTARDADEASLESAYRLLLRPAVTLVRLCLEHLERSPGGRIVAVTSLAAQEPTGHLALSNTFRPALTGWLKTLSREVGPKGITVNCVAPGRIDDREARRALSGRPDRGAARGDRPAAVGNAARVRRRRLLPRLRARRAT